MAKTNLVQSVMLPLSKIESNRGQIDGLPKNPRLIRDEKFNKLKKSIEEDIEMTALRELLVIEHDGKYVIIGGNMRFRAMQDLGIKEAPCKVIPADTDVEKLKAYTIKDNAGFGEWDWDDLANEWDAQQLSNWGVDTWQAEEQEEESTEGGVVDGEYTKKVEAPIYEPRGGANLSELAVYEKYERLIKQIEDSNVSESEKVFLRAAATRHIKFDYSKIADFYAEASPEMQNLIEASALVIIDYNKAVEEGYVRISQHLAESLNQ